jgi:hypothetical protein
VETLGAQDLAPTNLAIACAANVGIGSPATLWCRSWSFSKIAQEIASIERIKMRMRVGAA